MKTVLVTGFEGFIGKNLIAQLEQMDNITILRFAHGYSEVDLEKNIANSDFVFHLAGVNRPKETEEFTTGNRDLTQKIIKLLEKHNKQTPLLLASSVQAELDNPYGKSKKGAEKAVLDWAKSTGNKAYIYRLPNVFGKWCKPNYNSVVATFCHNIANNLDITIDDPGTELTLVYVDDVVEDFVRALKAEKKPNSDGFCKVTRDFTITLQKLADILKGFKTSRESLLIPNFENAFDRFLYATYTSYLDEKDFDYNLTMKHDERGWLAEFIKSELFGQVFISRTKPGISRGNHWHHTKIEKFLVIDGQADIKFRKLDSKDVLTYKVSGNKLKVLDIPAGYVHSITNTGNTDLLTLFWADEMFDPNKPDTYQLEV